MISILIAILAAMHPTASTARGARPPVDKWAAFHIQPARVQALTTRAAEGSFRTLLPPAPTIAATPLVRELAM